MSGYYYFLEKLKIVEKQLCKLNCSYGKVSHALKKIYKFSVDHVLIKRTVFVLIIKNVIKMKKLNFLVKLCDIRNKC